MNFFHNENQENIFFVRTNMSAETVDHMVADLEKMLPPEALENAYVGGSTMGEVRRDCRRLKVGQVPMSFWGSLVLQSAVLEANDRFFKFDLGGWTELLQYLRYSENDHYKAWHKDSATSRFNEQHHRKLTAILSLSDPEDYEGGEFCYYDNNVSGRTKFVQGEIAIFPSGIIHRVTPVKSGVRKMLIGWYGGPPFK